MIGHDSSLLNLVGHSTGALVFGIFLLLLARDRAGARLPGSRLTFAAAALAFLWNLGALLLNALPKPSPASSLVEMVSYISLSLLAPVLLHLSLNRLSLLALAGYATSAVAVFLHVLEVILARPEFHLYALSLIAVGLGAVTLASAVVLVRSARADRQSTARRVLGAACLFVFMVTFLHLGLEQGAPTWSTELVLHHATVPLALLIIVHNHRFVLLDALIRFCANAALAGAFTLIAHELIDWHVHQPASPADIPERATLILGIFLLLLLFAFTRDRLQKALTHFVFGRGDAAALASELRMGREDFGAESAYLPWAMDRVAQFMRANRVATVSPELEARLRSEGVNTPVLAAHVPEIRKALEDEGVEAVVPLWFSSSDAAFLLLGRRRGGQPYMSEDLRHLGQFAAQIVERVQGFRELELRRLADRAELRALQAQINPHFLFNALNAIYGLVPKQAAQARQTVLNLSDVFRYFLRNDDLMIPLEEEVRIIEAYLEIESLRLGSKLKREIVIDPEALPVLIPKLSLQPLVENAVKHGIAPKTAGGLVRLEASLGPDGLTVTVEDRSTGLAAGAVPESHGAGVGLQNVSRRLQLCYGPEIDLRVDAASGGTSVSFTIPAAKAAGVLR